MGTNYYLHEKPECVACGRGYEPLHIGKSSGGWCFALHVDPDNGINDLPDWEKRWAADGAYILNEYGEEIAISHMKAVILDRSWPHDAKPDAKFLRENDALLGPNGMLRHRLGPHCSGHGAGTYDLCPGEFS